MATPAGQDLAVCYNGTQLTGTSGSVTRVLKRLPRFSPFALKPDGTLVGATDVIAEQGDPPVDAMKLTLSMTHRIEGVASALIAEPYSSTGPSRSSFGRRRCRPPSD